MILSDTNFPIALFILQKQIDYVTGSQDTKTKPIIQSTYMSCEHLCALSSIHLRMLFISCLRGTYAIFDK